MNGVTRLGGAAAVAGLLASGLVAAGAQAPSVALNAAGDIVVPDVDYQRDWTMLGIFAHLGDDSVGQFNVVYTQPESVSAYQSTGAWPPGAVLVKELRKGRTTSDGKDPVSSLGDLTGWFVMVKPAPGMDASGPLWGDGWGWAKFSADAPKTTVSKNYQTDCLECHRPVEQSDWVHVDAYPLVRK